MNQLKEKGLSTITWQRFVVFAATAPIAGLVTLFISTKFSGIAGSPLEVFIKIESFAAAVVVGAAVAFKGVLKQGPSRFTLGHAIPWGVQTLAICVLVILILTLIVQTYRESVWTVGRQVHLFAIGCLLLGLSIILTAHRKIRIKTRLWGRYIAVQHMIVDNSPWWQGTPSREKATEQAISQIFAVFAHLSQALDQPSANLIYHLYRRAKKTPRLFGLWLENAGAFHCEFFYPNPPGPYTTLVTHYRPVKHDPGKHKEFLERWKNGVAAGAEQAFENEKAAVTSQFGALWDELKTETKGKIHEPIIDVDDLDSVSEPGQADPYFEQTFQTYLREGLHIRSLHMRLLKAGNKRLGILVIMDPLQHGLTLRDQDHLEGYCHLLQLVLARYLHFRSLPEQEISVDTAHLDGTLQTEQRE